MYNISEQSFWTEYDDYEIELQHCLQLYNCREIIVETDIFLNINQQLAHIKFKPFGKSGITVHLFHTHR